MRTRWYSGPASNPAQHFVAPLHADEQVTAVGRAFWGYGEHHQRVQRATGEVVTLPTVWLDDAATRALPKCPKCGRACSHPSGTHTGCAER